MPNWLTINILMLSALSLLLSGCAKQQLANQAHIEQEVAEQAQNTTATVEGIIQQAEQNLDKALADQLNFFAPLHIANAQDSLSQARQQLESPPENIKNAALMSAIAANKLIEKAYENKKAVSSHLRDMFAAKKILDELNFPAHYQDEYDDLMEDIKDLIRQFEAGQTREAITEQSELIQDMTELEITILTERHVSPAISFLQKAEDMNAEDYAPISFILAQTEIEHAQDYIQANNRNRIGVENAGKQALLAAQKAYFMAQDVKPLINMLPEESETHVDAIFTSLININDKLST